MLGMSTVLPDKSTIDGSTANEAAIKRDNPAHGRAIIIRQDTYLNYLHNVWSKITAE
jgi:hypothetical protein